MKCFLNTAFLDKLYPGAADYQEGTVPTFKGKIQGRQGGPKVGADPRLVSVSGAASGVAVSTDESSGDSEVLAIWMTCGESASKSPVRIGTVYATSTGPLFVPGDPNG